MADLVDYSSSLYVYDDIINYDAPDVEIIIEPEEPTIPPSTGAVSSGSSSSAGYSIAYPMFTPEQVLKWIQTFSKKKINLKFKIKVNDKEHISFSEFIEQDNLKTIKEVVFKVQNLSKEIIKSPKIVVVKFNKVEDIE